MNAEVEKVVSLLPVMKQLFEQDTFLTVIDRNGIICGFAIPDGVPPQRKIGEKFVDPTGGFDEVMRTGRRKFNYLPKEVMGEAFQGYLVPIKEGNSVVGCLTCTYSVDEKERIGEIVKEFNTSSQQVNEKISKIVSDFDALYKMIDGINSMTGNVSEDINSSEKIVRAISNNADKSNILALNASIEAARSGEYGKGFAVVAKEMEILAKSSSKSTMEIQKQLKQMHESINSMITSINGTDEVAKSYNVQIKEIQDVVARMLEMANEMEKNFKLPTA